MGNADRCERTYTFDYQRLPIDWDRIHHGIADQRQYTQFRHFR